MRYQVTIAALVAGAGLFVSAGGCGQSKISECNALIEVINKGLRAMDPTAVTLCMENKVPIVVFDLMTKGNVRSILLGEAIGTLVQ